VKSVSINSDSVTEALPADRDDVPETRSPEWLSERIWIAACVVIILAGAFLRLYKLEFVPLHHDEGVNGFFLTNLYRDHVYHYDPENYHGPTLYYFALVMSYVFGLTTLAIRLTTALFGVGTIWLILTLRQRIGAFGALAAATYIALSPGAVYFSRYFIHETLFVFFTLGLIVYWFKYRADPWPGYLIVAAIMAGMLFATKETAIINAAAIVGAAIASGFYISVRVRIAGYLAARKQKNEAVEVDQTDGTADVPNEKVNQNQAEAPPPAPISKLVGAAKDPRTLLIWASATAAFLFVMVMLYSSMFTYWHGVKDALRALSFWTKTGETGHVHPWSSYILWMWEEESPLLVLGLIGIAVSLWLARSRFAVFMSILSLAILIGYSAVPYKTPWLALSIIVPLAITAGYGLDVLYQQSGSLWEVALSVGLILAPGGFLLRQAIELNFFHYDDDRYAYVYAHTRRETLALVDKIAEIAQLSGRGNDLSITITSPEYWPLPWYFRDYKNAGFYGKMVNRGDLVVIGSKEQDAELQKTLGNDYIPLGIYTLRPGTDLVLYAKHTITRPGSQASGS
jgi:uncharacterized protein (TIGR03663 family)